LSIKRRVIADAIAHFHVANLVYFGEVFPGDGYPLIDFAHHGSLDGFLKTLESWTDSSVHIVPARGETTNGDSVKAFCDMLVTVRGRVQQMINSGQTEHQILARHPTAEFDAQWGHGRVSPDAFVHEVYLSLTTAKLK
jgi:hypothetical protein